MEKVLIAFQQYSENLTTLPTAKKAVFGMVPVADVPQLGKNGIDGLPAKTLKSCRSSLRDSYAPSAYYFKGHRRPGEALKDFALRAACAATTE